MYEARGFLSPLRSGDRDLDEDCARPTAGDGFKPPISRANTGYARLAADPGYRRLSGISPVLATWDDHDYGENDAGAEYPMKQQSERIFLDFFGVPPGAPAPLRPGIYAE